MFGKNEMKVCYAVPSLGWGEGGFVTVMSPSTAAAAACRRASWDVQVPYGPLSKAGATWLVCPSLNPSIALVATAEGRGGGSKRRKVYFHSLGIFIGDGGGHGRRLLIHLFWLINYPLSPLGKKKKLCFKFCCCFSFNVFSVQGVSLWLLQHMGDLSHGSK